MMRIFNYTSYIVAAVMILCGGTVTARGASRDSLRTDAADSISSTENNPKVRELQELIVEGKNAWIEGNKVVFIPRKSEKNLAVDASSLIENMNTGVLVVKNGQILARGGNPVAIYINGRPAMGIDLSTFWPQNAVRVEYIEDSTDPRFAGSNYAVNFIMKEYAFGGLTKINGRQNFPNNGTYSAASKFVYKDLTYSANVGGGYSRDHRSSTVNTKTYHDIYYDNIHYDKVERTEEGGAMAARNDAMHAVFNAYYNRHNTTYINHSIQYSWDRNPGSFNTGDIRYTPAIISGNKSRSDDSSRKNALSASGMYFFRFSNSRHIFRFDWDYKYSHNNFYSSYREEGATSISNQSREDFNQTFMKGEYSVFINDYNNLSLFLDGTSAWYDTDYDGSYLGKQKIFQGIYNLSASYSWSPARIFGLNLRPSLTFHTRNVEGSARHNQWSYGLKGGIYLRSHRNNVLRFDAEYFVDRPAASMISDIILRQNELEWLKGNPYLDFSKLFSLILVDFWMPTPSFNINFMMSWSFNTNEIASEFTPGGVEHDGVIRQYYNSKNNGLIDPQISMNYSLLRGKLKFSGSLTYRYLYSTGRYSRHLSWWRPRLGARYTLGNFMFDVDYSHNEKIFSNAGMTTTKSGATLDFSVTFGNGPWYVRLRGNDLANNKAVTTVETISPYYTEVARNFSTGRSVSLSLTYTFDYGKKVDPGIDAYEKSIFSTAVLGK